MGASSLAVRIGRHHVNRRPLVRARTIDALRPSFASLHDFYVMTAAFPIKYTQHILMTKNHFSIGKLDAMKISVAKP